jgi:hypothetical protein
MHPSVVRLAELMPPHPGAGDSIDWDEVAQQRGTRFPADYRDFVSVYGGGSINNSFYVGLPLTTEPETRGPLSFASLTSSGYDLIGADPEEIPEWAGRIAWASDCSANHAFWDTSDPDPDKWTTIVLERRGEWTGYRCGVVDFLVGFLSKEITPQPMGLFSPDQPVFLHWREEQRLKAAGIRPWPHL